MKALIDQVFSDHYNTMIFTAKKYITKSGFNLKAEDVVSNCYMKAITIEKEMTYDDIVKWAFGFIRREPSLENSFTRYEIKKDKKLFTHIEEDQFINEYEHESEYYQTDICEKFRLTLDRYNRNLFDAYYYKGLTKKREMAEHFKIDETSAFFLIKNLKTKFKEYVKTEERI